MRKTDTETISIQSLHSSELGKQAGSCYAELMAMRCFRRAVKNYAFKSMDPNLLGALVRNIADERGVFAFRDTLFKKTEDGSMEVSEDEDDLLPNLDGTREILARMWRHARIRERCRRQMLAWSDAIISEYEELSKDDPLRGRLAELKSTLRLSEDEMSVLEVLWLVSIDKLEEFEVPFSMSRLSGSIALMTGMSEQAVRNTMISSSRLCRFGCLCAAGRDRVHPKIRYYLDGLNDEPLASSFYRRDDSEVLPVEFFGKVTEEHLPVLKRMLAGSHGRKLNILLYGAPGTGKSSFARAVAEATGRIAYQIQQRPRDRDGGMQGASPEIRYAAVEICNEQTDADTSLIIVDEADVLLRCNRFGFASLVESDAATVGDKGLLNDVLERIETPTVWIANTRAEELDSSSRRRFDYAIRFDPLTKEQRLATWRNAARKAGVDASFSEETLAVFAEEYPVCTGIAAKAFGNVARVGAAGEEAKELLEKLLSSQVELSGASRTDERAAAPMKGYSLEGLNIRTPVPLELVERAVRRFLDAETRKVDRDSPRMNILLTGVPGSGKTEFVKHLAESVGRPLMIRKASDLKSKWVGETEQNIATAFREAGKRNAVLFFDEVDTFLDDREALSQGHEKAMVNEVLQQMENFGGVFVGSTNFKDSLDPAVARRFTFKIELAALDVRGREVFWRKFFGAAPETSITERLSSMEGLTPGDFRTVRQELYYLGEEVTDLDRIKALQSELDARSGRTRPIGFGA